MYNQGQLLDGSIELQYLQKYIQLGIQTKYKKNDIILLKEFGHYLVLEGSVTIKQQKVDGEEVPFGIMKQNKAFLRSFQSDYNIYAKCNSNTTICFFNKDLIYNIMSKDKDVMIEITEHIISIAHMHHNRIFNTSFMQAQDKILNAIFRLMLQNQPNEKGVYRIPFAITQKEFAHSLNIHFTTCYRIVSKLKELSLIDFKNNYMYVYDKTKLEEILFNLEIIKY